MQELDRVKKNRNKVVGIPRKRLEEKAKALADQGEWTSFVDVLALLVFGIVLFPNVDGLMDLAAIDTFLAYHHNKESPVIAVLVDAYDTFDLDVKRAVLESSVVHPFFMYGWSPTFFVMKIDPSVPYKVITCVLRKGKQIGRNSW